MITYTIADTHFAKDSNNLMDRPFSNSLDMSLEILENINSRVSRKDLLIIVGDFSFKECEYWRNKIRCKNTILILGNHDKRAQSIKAFGHMKVREQYMTKICKHPCYFSHYPTLYWPSSHYGSFHCFGHVHDRRTETIESFFPQIRAMDVSPEAAFRILGKWTCFKDQEIYDTLSTRQGHDPIEFYKTPKTLLNELIKKGEL